ncbi:MAG TPA: NAD(P)-dependent oxidoreductase [Gemmatimonadales bacterium]|jgi:3-hydroxyisobutyrate dehydrogenase|nr:NAD(P)-dependent oxidoreductase [Gemmatimonadales bacterium]
MRIAFLGLGAIGRPMAARLARVHELTVWNRTAERARAFAEQHAARVAATPKDAAAGAEVVLTCLPTSADVERLLDGAEGLEAGLGRGALFLDCTSGDAATTRRIAARLAKQGVAFADAPVSGGTNGAEQGILTVMVGGDPAVFERAVPVLQAFGKRIVHMGPLGSGDAMKAVNNTLLGVNILALAEALTALVKAGVNPRLAVETLNASSGRSFVSESLIPERVLTGTWPRTFKLALLDKDVGICLGLLEELRMPAPLLERARALLHEARTALGEDADYLEPIKLQEQRTGVELRG